MIRNYLSPCHKDLDDLFDLEYPSDPRAQNLRKRRSTESWLRNEIENEDIKFKYFITLTFNRAQTSLINQYLDNKHIKNVILSFFYPRKKPNDRIKVWIFVERHQKGTLHLHLLMEGMDGLTWLMKNNRKIQISKRTLFDVIASDYSIDDLITEALTNHLQTHIRKLGTSKQSVDCRKIGNIQKRVHYVNKSLDSIDFDGWEHIDFENSDFGKSENDFIEDEVTLSPDLLAKIRKL